MGRALLLAQRLRTVPAVPVRARPDSANYGLNDRMIFYFSSPSNWLLAKVQSGNEPGYSRSLQISHPW